MTQKRRDSNLELYRIVLMLLIISHHYVVNSGLMDLMCQSPYSAKSVYLNIFGMWGKTGINCFVLITGYFMCKSEATLSKFVKLVLMMLFYNVVFNCFFAKLGYWGYSNMLRPEKILPVKDLSSCFTSCFLVFYLFIPFLTIIVNSFTRKQHLCFCALCLFVFSAWPQLTPFDVTFNYVIWFGILFVVSSYIRKYNLWADISHKKWGMYSLISILVSISSVFLMCYLHQNMHYFVSDCNAIMAVVTSVCTFMYFKTMSLPYNRFINMVASAVFGVLCIHANSDIMRQWLWKDTLNCTGWYESNIYLHSIICVISIFVICVIIDLLRQRFIESWVMAYLDKIVERLGFDFYFIKWK